MLDLVWSQVGGRNNREADGERERADQRLEDRAAQCQWNLMFPRSRWRRLDAESTPGRTELETTGGKEADVCVSEV
nr:hypothetical protein CFP56_21103 [Quercus suber]